MAVVSVFSASAFAGELVLNPATRADLSPRQTTAIALGTPIATDYRAYCQPTYPPQAKPLCTGIGGEVDPTTPASSDEVVTWPVATLEPLGPYQQDKAILFPLP